MKFAKAIVTVAAISLLAVPAMADNAAVQTKNKNQGICQFSTDTNPDGQQLARRGNGNGGGQKGHGPGDGTGNGGNGPKDGTGPRSQNGTCTKT